jgi:hypothetical protein
VKFVVGNLGRCGNRANATSLTRQLFNNGKHCIDADPVGERDILTLNRYDVIRRTRDGELLSVRAKFVIYHKIVLGGPSGGCY